MRTINFRTDRFEFAHGKKPRGEGSWAFEFRRSSAYAKGGEAIINPDSLDEVWFAPYYRTFRSARLWALAKAKELGAHTVIVLS